MPVRMPHRILLIAGAASALAVMPAAVSAAAWHGRYTTIDVPGAAATIAVDVNDFGVVVGFYFTSNGTEHGFIDRHGVFTTVNDPHAGTASGQGTVAFAINNRGIIVGIYADSHGTTHGFELNNAR